MAIEGLNAREVVPVPLWNSPMPASQQQKNTLSRTLKTDDDRAVVVPQNKVDYTFKDIVQGTEAGKETDDSYSFWDFLDVINPLQHIPIVSSVYRYLTGDEIKGAARVAGGALYGGPLGMAAGAVNAVIAQNEGDDIGGLALARIFGPSEQDSETGKAIPDTEIAEVKQEDLPPIRTSRFDPQTLDIAAENIKNSRYTVNSSTAESTAEKEPTYIVAQNNVGNSQWQAFYSHQMDMEQKKLNEIQELLSDDSYERDLMFQAEQESIAEQNQIRMIRDAVNKERVESIERIKRLATDKQIQQETAVKEYVRTNQYGLRESAGMYPTTAP